MNYNFNDYEMDLFFEVPKYFENENDEQVIFIRPDKVIGFNIIYGYKTSDEKEYYKIRFYLGDEDYVDTYFMPGIEVMAYLRDFERKLEFVTKRVK